VSRVHSEDTIQHVLHFNTGDDERTRIKIVVLDIFKSSLQEEFFNDWVNNYYNGKREKMKKFLLSNRENLIRKFTSPKTKISWNAPC